MSFPSLKDHSLVLSIVQCLKSIASYILSSCIVFGGRAHLVPVISSLLEGEVLIYGFDVCSCCHMIEIFHLFYLYQLKSCVKR